MHASTKLGSSLSSTCTTRRQPTPRDHTRTRTPVPVSSSESSPASSSHPSIPVKRASPHNSYNPPSKRPKSSPHKENLYQTSFKEKAREYPIRQIDFTRVTPPSVSTPSTPHRPRHDQTFSQPQRHVTTEPVSQQKVRRFLELDYSSSLNVRHYMRNTNYTQLNQHTAVCERVDTFQARHLCGKRQFHARAVRCPRAKQTTLKATNVCPA